MNSGKPNGKEFLSQKGNTSFHSSIHVCLRSCFFLLYSFFEGDHLIIVPWLPPASCPSACRRQASLHDRDTQLFASCKDETFPTLAREAVSQALMHLGPSPPASLLCFMQPRKDTCQPRGTASAFVLAVMEFKSHVMFIDFDYSLCVHLN